LKEKTDESELDMFNEFNSYVNQVLKENKKKNAKFYHWSWAEPCSYNRFKNKNLNTRINDNNFTFYDLNKVFVSEPVIIKDALDFSLKTVAKALYKYKLIKSCWDLSSPCSNGLTAMILANKIYENNNLSSKSDNERSNFSEKKLEPKLSIGELCSPIDNEHSDFSQKNSESKLSIAQCPIDNEPIMKEIIYYNEIDCKVLWEIHEMIKAKM
jgi:hypothetical protein